MKRKWYQEWATIQPSLRPLQTVTTATTAQLLIHNSGDRTITDASRRKHTNALYNSFDVSAVNVTASRVTWEMGLWGVSWLPSGSGRSYCCGWHRARLGCWCADTKGGVQQHAVPFPPWLQTRHGLYSRTVNPNKSFLPWVAFVKVIFNMQTEKKWTRWCTPVIPALRCGGRRIRSASGARSFSGYSSTQEASLSYSRPWLKTTTTKMNGHTLTNISEQRANFIRQARNFFFTSLKVKTMTTNPKLWNIPFFFGGGRQRKPKP